MPYLAKATIVNSIKIIDEYLQSHPSADIQLLLEDLKEFVVRMEQAAYHYFSNSQLITHLRQNKPDHFNKWIACFKEPEKTDTTFFWETLEKILNNQSKLYLLGLPPEILTWVGADDEYELVYPNFINMPEYAGQWEKVRQWELCCLSGIPDAFDFARTKLGLTPDTRNEFGQFAVHLVALSHSCRLMKHVLDLGFDSSQKTVMETREDGLTPLEIAEQNNDQNMLTLLRNYSNRASISEDARITVHLPVGVYARNRFGKIPTAQEIDQYGLGTLLMEEVKPDQPFNFAMLANRLTAALAGDEPLHLMAGETIPEMKTIIEPEYWSDRYGTIYSVKLSVKLADLNGPMTINELYGPQFTARLYGRYWFIKPDANIQLGDIIGIHLLTEFMDDHAPKIQEAKNPDVGKPGIMPHLNAESVKEHIKAFLHDKTFWCQSVIDWKAPLGYSSFPAPIQRMQALCVPNKSVTENTGRQWQDKLFLLKSFKKIAQEYLTLGTGVTGYIGSLFPYDPKVKMFCQALIEAKSFYDVAKAIDGMTPTFAPAEKKSYCALI